MRHAVFYESIYQNCQNQPQKPLKQHGVKPPRFFNNAKVTTTADFMDDSRDRRVYEFNYGVS